MKLEEKMKIVNKVNSENFLNLAFEYGDDNSPRVKQTFIDILNKDKELFLLMMKHLYEIGESEFIHIFFSKTNYTKDKELVKKLLEYNNLAYLGMHEDLNSDIEFMSELVKLTRGRVYMHAKEEAREDKELALLAFKEVILNQSYDHLVHFNRCVGFKKVAKEILSNDENAKEIINILENAIKNGNDEISDNAKGLLDDINRMIKNIKEDNKQR